MYICGFILVVFAVISAYPTTAKPKDGYCQECVHYNFEQDFSSLFSRDGICTGLNSWLENKYSSSNIDQPNEYSQSFISTQSELSCVTSFPFKMAGGGSVNVRVYMDSAGTDSLDQVYVLAEEVTENDMNPTIGIGVLSSFDSVNGWQILNFTIISSSTFDGRLTFMGLNTHSVVAVDAFCYKPPGFEGECWEHDYSTTTTVEPYTTVTETYTEVVTHPTTEIETTTKAGTHPTPESEIESTTSVVTKSTLVTEIEPSPTSEPTAVTEKETTSVPSITVPQPTLPTPAPMPGNRCPDDPFIHWLLPHGSNCTLFYYCVWGQKVLRECASGLHFNPEIQACDWPVSAGCTAK